MRIVFDGKSIDNLNAQLAACEVPAIDVHYAIVNKGYKLGYQTVYNLLKGTPPITKKTTLNTFMGIYLYFNTATDSKTGE